MKKQSFLLCLVAGTFFKSGIMMAQTQVSTSYYWDNRNFNTAQIALSAKQLGNGFSVWGFTDLHARQQTEDRYDLETSFSEYRLSNNRLANWTGIANLDLQLEYNDFTPGNDNSTWRGGFTYRTAWSEGTWTQLRIFPLQSRDMGQISLTYYWSISDKVKLSGFADYNFVDNGSNQWVVEPQFNFRLSKHLWALLEYRYNGFQDENINLDGSGLAAGLRFDF